jgi:hypothetical protein
MKVSPSSGGPWFNEKALEGGEEKHNEQNGERSNGIFPPQDEQSDERHGPAGESPAEITGKEGADYPAGRVSIIDSEDDRRQDKGEYGDPTDPEGNSETIENGKYLHVASDYNVFCNCIIMENWMRNYACFVPSARPKYV